MLHLQNVILEMIATGKPLHVTMDRLCVEVEAALPNVVCSILRITPDGLLHPLSSPSLPKTYCQALDGLSIGPNVGSCGTAAYLGTAVSVTDIASDPKWCGFKHYVLPLGLRACWSSPISTHSGRVLGTFAFYYRDARGPTPEEKHIVSTCLHLSMIALERHERVLESDRLANNDALTGLSNRARFNRVLTSLPCATADAWSLLVIDLDNLKVTNDTFGHHTGDELLKEVATRIMAVAGSDTVFRLGSDEFAVIISHTVVDEEIEALAHRILSAFEEPATCNGHLIHPRATIGGATLSAEDASADSVRQKADFALYHAKETGRGGFVRYWPGIGSAITKRLKAIQDVNSALQDGRIQAYYQPVVDLDTGAIVGAEALCRLITPEGQVVSASQFYEATSDAHVACAITDQMLAQVVLDVQKWIKAGTGLKHIGLNISYADIQRGMLSDRLAAAFTQAGVPLDHLTVEITEDVYLSGRHKEVVREIAAMRAKGIRVALDDFGTGFASLTHLLTVPVDIIKIDKSFVNNLKPGTPSSVIVDGLLTIAHKLGIEVIAEGIEDPSQYEHLKAYAGTLGQGYLFSKAVDRDAMTRLFQKPPYTTWGEALPPLPH